MNGVTQRWFDDERFQHRWLLTGTNEQRQIIRSITFAEERFLEERERDKNEPLLIVSSYHFDNDEIVRC